MTIITLHHLCFSHCMNSSVIVLNLRIFLWELRSLRKIPWSKTITSDFTQILISLIDVLKTDDIAWISFYKHILEYHFINTLEVYCYLEFKLRYLKNLKLFSKKMVRSYYCLNVLFASEVITSYSSNWITLLLLCISAPLVLCCDQLVVFKTDKAWSARPGSSGLWDKTSLANIFTPKLLHLYIYLISFELHLILKGSQLGVFCP